jgi:hypothetical protein
MTKHAAAQVDYPAEFGATSGLYRRAATNCAPFNDAVATSSDDGASYLGILWSKVALGLQQLPARDPRRRLLELAQLRHDAKLADAILRNL